MQSSSRLKLVFHLGDFGFTLPVAQLVEVREGADIWLDRTEAEPEKSIIGRLPHRGETIPVVDLRTLLKMPEVVREVLNVLVLAGANGPWGALVDRVEGIFSDGEFLTLEVPMLLDPGNLLPYRFLDVRKETPFIQADVHRLDAWRSLAE